MNMRHVEIQVKHSTKLKFKKSKSPKVDIRRCLNNATGNILSDSELDTLTDIISKALMN